MARLLLDENMPRVFVRWMVGHQARTVQSLGWSGLKNGELLRAAQSDFDIFVTLDRNVRFQQSVRSLDIAVLVLRTPSSKPEDLEHLVREALEAIPRCVPGTVTEVGSWGSEGA